jgi:hypothetical protein
MFRGGNDLYRLYRESGTASRHRVSGERQITCSQWIIQAGLKVIAPARGHAGPDDRIEGGDGPVAIQAIPNAASGDIEAISGAPSLPSTGGGSSRSGRDGGWDDH